MYILPEQSVLCGLFRSQEVKASTSSMTAVPKPLRFLKPHYEALRSHLDVLRMGQDRTNLAGLVSVLAMTSSESETRDCLKYCLLGGILEATSWGHEYLRHLAGEVGQEFATRTSAGTTSSSSSPSEKDVTDLLRLVDVIVPFHMAHNAEPEAVDLLLEVEQLPKLVQHVDAKNYQRACLYLISCCSYLGEPDNMQVLEVAFDIYMLPAIAQYTDAARIALKMNSMDRINRVFCACGAAAPSSSSSSPSSSAPQGKITSGKLVRRQVCYLLGRQGIMLDLDDEDSSVGAAVAEDDEEREVLREIIGNVKLSEHYLHLARDLDVLEPRAPEDVYKLHLLDDRRGPLPMMDSAKANLASSFVNALVNAGFGTDKLITATAPTTTPPATTAAGRVSDDGSAGSPSSKRGSDTGVAAAAAAAAAEEDEEEMEGSVRELREKDGGLPSGGGGGVSDSLNWVFKHKNEGMTTATASLGMITMWDVDGGLSLLDKYLYTGKEEVTAGALLGVGLLCTTVRHETQPAMALLAEHVTSDRPLIQSMALMGLGLAYAGTGNNDVAELILPVCTDVDAKMDVIGYAAVALGLVFAGSMNEDAVNSILQTLMMRSEIELTEPHAAMVCLGLGLLFLGQQDACEATAEITLTLSDRISKMAKMCVEMCAYAGTGDVLRVQEFLTACTESSSLASSPPNEQGVDAGAGASAAGGSGSGSGGDGSGSGGDEKWKSWHQGPAVLGIALCAMAEDLGSSMAYRTFEHLLQYGERPVRQAVPLALGILNVSNPEIGVIDILSRLSHDHDPAVAQSAVLGLGLAGAGTNNARLAGMLRQLGQYHAKDSTALLLVRVSQGLVHLGKGLMTLSPYHAERQLLSLPALGGILASVFACLFGRHLVGGKHHMMLFYLATAMFPRMLMTLDEEGRPLAAGVRVGQAVDVVAQAGRPKAITGFQTHTTPVLLSYGERAQLANDKYLPVSSMLEGFVILQPNPDSVENDE